MSAWFGPVKKVILKTVSFPNFRFLLSGFELELYSTHEYPYLYWYLYELLFPWLTTCLHRADTYLVEHEQIMESQHKQTGKSSYIQEVFRLDFISIRSRKRMGCVLTDLKASFTIQQKTLLVLV